MRTLTPPAPISRCPDCRGELRLKRVERAEGIREIQQQTLLCGHCGREVVCLVDDRIAGNGAASNYSGPSPRV